MFQIDRSISIAGSNRCNAGRNRATTAIPMKPILAFFSVVSVTGCLTADGGPPDPETDVSASSLRAQSRAQPLPDWSTGTNSATVGDGLLFDEVNIAGPNRSGLKIQRSMLEDGTPLQFYVERHNLKAIDPSGNIYSDIQLRGATIQLRYDERGAEYELKITNVVGKGLQFWAGPPEDVPYYEIMARRTDGPQIDQFEYICQSNFVTSDPTWAANVEHAALVFQGDVYDPVTKMVTEVPDWDPRFNLACANTAPAKMHLTRHTRAGSVDNNNQEVYWTDVLQRQAMLRMFTADYCGGGTSYTVDGQPLAYADDRTEFPRWSGATQLEALWDYRGAICLNTPRRGAAVRDAVNQSCPGIPRCLPLAPAYKPSIVISQLVP